MEAVISFLEKHFQQNVSLLSQTPIVGGDINDVYKITTSQGIFCVKRNYKNRFPQMFSKETQGLQLLHENTLFKVPKVIGITESEDMQYLILEFIESGRASKTFWEDFGENLARMHQSSSPTFGLAESNYIGSLVQSNNRHEKWASFYAEERILPQLKFAYNKGLIPDSLLKATESLCSRFDSLIPSEPPALIHGDLWSGNFMTDQDGNPVLIDPAVYFGHREMDLGMMHLFGGFDRKLFERYNEVFPLETDWTERLSLTQLYPLLVHVNLFGKSYVSSVQSAVKCNS